MPVMSPDMNGKSKTVSTNYFACTLGEALRFKENNPTGFATVSDLIERQALDHPDDYAVGFPNPNTKKDGNWGSRLYTFEDLERGSRISEDETKVFREIHGESKSIALLCPSSVEFLFAWLRLVRAGFSVLIIAPQCQPNAIAHLCSACDASVLLYHEIYRNAALITCQIEGTSITSREIPWKVDFPYLKIDESNAIFGHRSLKDDIAYVFHTSGTSSGLPKPVPQSHHAAVGVLPNLNGTDAATFTTTPLYHGGIADCFRAWSSGAMIWLFPEISQPITTQNILKCLTTAEDAEVSNGCPSVKYFSGVPYILEMLAEERDGLEALKRMDMVGVGGSALSSKCGDNLVLEGVKLLSRMGSAECGFLLSSNRDFNVDKEWQYLRLSEHGGRYLRLEKQGDRSGLSELVVLKGWPHMSKVNRDNGSFATSDLFEPHPEIPDAWRYHSRADSQITLKTGKKFDPAPLEDEIRSASSRVGDVYIFGNGKQYPGLLAFSSGVEEDSEFSIHLWHVVQEINARGQEHTRIPRHMIIIKSPGSKGLKKSSKGTIFRGEAEKDFHQEISRLYESEDKPNGDSNTFEKLSRDEIYVIVEDIITQSLGREEKLGLNKDFYREGMNSTQCTQIRGRLEKNLCLAAGSLPWNVVYDCGCIERLVAFFVNLRDGSLNGQDATSDNELMLELVKRFSVFEPKILESTLLKPNSEIDSSLVVLTGATGSLGVHILEQLRSSNKVSQIICLIRASSHKDARTRVSESLKKRNKPPLAILPKGRIICVPFNLSAPDLGLTPELQNYISQNATHFIHAAWPVNFSISLQSFESQLLGLQNLLNLAISCSSDQTQLLFCSSTASVLGPNHAANIMECVSTNPSDSDTIGYSKSKWVAEAICDTAAGQPDMMKSKRVKILRIGQLTGDSENGIWNMSEAWPLMLSTASKLGCLPRLDEKLTWLPMDVAAKAVLDIAFNSTQGEDDAEATSLVYHIVNNNQERSWMDLLTWIAKRGHPFEIVDVEEWLKKLDELDDHPAKSLVGLWKAGARSSTEETKLPVVFDMTRSMASSEALRNVRPVDEELVGKIWEWLRGEMALERQF